MTTANAAVTRARMDRSAGPVITQQVTRPADGTQRRPLERPVDLAAEIADVDAHDVRVCIDFLVPDVGEQPRPTERLVRVPHEVLEQRELLRGQMDLLWSAKDLPAGRVEDEVTESQRGRPRLGAAADE